MPTDAEVIERFQDLYGLKIQDICDSIIEQFNYEAVDILNNRNRSFYADFEEFIMKSADLNSSLSNKK